VLPKVGTTTKEGAT